MRNGLVCRQCLTNTRLKSLFTHPSCGRHQREDGARAFGFCLVAVCRLDKVGGSLFCLNITGEGSRGEEGGYAVTPQVACFDF